MGGPVSFRRQRGPRDLLIGLALLLGIALALAPVWFIAYVFLTEWLGGVADIADLPFLSEPQLYSGGRVTRVFPVTHALVYVLQAISIVGLIVITLWAIGRSLRRSRIWSRLAWRDHRCG